ncbi:MAG: hypothetical protein K0Q73_8811, partial [Paenibacillus sp.]|nr:hypothetical protein [Paenibacillus sp.]
MEAREFGEYIKSLRKSKKMTIRQLELYSGVSNAYISQIERGLRDIPSPDILEKLSKHLGVDHDDLMRKAGYIETAEALDKMNSFLYKFADSVTLDKDAIRAIN